MNFWKKIGTTAAIALVFGIVSGLCFSGVNYALKIGRRALQQVRPAQEAAEEPGGENKKQEKAESEEPADNNTSSEVVSSGIKTRLISTGRVPDIAAEVMPSVVAITNLSVVEYRSIWYGSQSYESKSVGSGIIVSEDDDYVYIITNNHVISGAKTITVTFVDDEACGAEVRGASSTSDLAVVTVAKSDLPSATKEAIRVATLGDSSNVVVGQECIAIGNAMGYGQSVTLGIVSALDREITATDTSTGAVITNKLIQTDAAINPGNSGGALLDASGAVIGINSVKYSSTDVEGMGYAIPINEAKQVVNKFISQEKVADDNKAFLGISGIEVSKDTTASYGIPEGLCITKVGEGSSAEQAGLAVGDIITNFNGRKISTMDEVAEEMEYLSAGDRIEVVVAKKSDGYKEKTVTVTLGKREDTVAASGGAKDAEEEPEEEVPEEAPEDIQDRGNYWRAPDISDDYWPFNFFN